MREGWIRIPFGSVVTIASGQVDPKKKPFADMISVGPDNLLSGGGMDKEGLHTARELGQISGKYAFDDTSILYSKIRPNLNKVALPDFSGICSADMYPLWPSDEQRADRRFIYFTLSSARFVSDATSRSFRTGLPKINRPDLEEIEILLPPLPEQRKIAEILRTWDEALEKLAALRAAKQDRFTGLTQQITGRGGVFPQRWPLKALSEVSNPVRRKSAGDNHPVMTISAKSGFLMQSDKFARDMAGQSVERYTLLHEGEFAYNKGNSKTAPYGCVYRLDRPTALVPFVYFCFALKPGLDPEFYEHLFAAGALNHNLSRLINSGVRNDGLLNLYSEDFFSCRVPVPPLEEQRRIARTLTAAKQELALLDAEIEALTRQKRGLMQKLLTGEWRVTLDPSEPPAATEEADHAG
ncbi:restriction endonuclease subunit S [Rhodobacter maris]|uniref:Type I restriction enzyme S subunit n=1 Tax=Rhodobacter maris TaxID=446682 RepID=A0A285T7E4_9RHOB|nr:restriction endonuclease subunit S [Rhodobacter maris]SOC17347.1 type I restriction enzyme S subunit [Rhodobacter maris]